jgi:succinate dehydrogenase/fumarate reductase flavoprotein subunit
MSSHEIKTEWIETDVLCVGGGPAGLCAAIRASELGAKVIVADKSNTLRSGDAGMGNDHFRCYIPEVHGDDIEVIVKETAVSQSGGHRPEAFVRLFLQNSTEMVRRWDRWGIPMKFEGKYEFAGHGYPGHPLILLHYSGQDTKPVLTKQATKNGAKIMNRVMIFDLLSENGVVCGALGVDTREPRLIVFKAKSVILATGKAMRLFPGATPGWLFNVNTSPINTGDGRTMAYRAGCELTNIELTSRWAGPKYFARNGKGSWMGVLRDPHGQPVGPFVSKPDRHTGDMTWDIYKGLFDDYTKSGRGPVYMDLAGMSKEDYEYMKYWLVHEANTPVLDYMEREGADPREHPIEFMTYGMFNPGGIYYNEKGETPVEGLYAAGDEFYAFVIAGAAVFGWLAGGSAARHAMAAASLETGGRDAGIEESKAQLEQILKRETGATWQEANIALQQVMHDYCGLVRSQTLLEAGLHHLTRLKRNIKERLAAKNQHELMRCIEVLNLVDLGELTFIAAQERKETRGGHNRVDHPYSNPLLNDQLLTVRKVDGKPVAEWRKRP